MSPWRPFRLGDDRGQVVVIVALSITAFLTLVALAVDTGNWFTHKRNLQNRADAGALAAGVEYAKGWQQCLAGNAMVTTNIINAARKFSGDPAATGPENTQIADQSKLSVFVNSRSYNGPDYDDGPPAVTASPCYNHPPDAADTITPEGGFWTDVKVKETDLASFFGKLGLPLSRNTARARVEIEPITSQKNFLPLAVPTNDLLKGQIRYYLFCNGVQSTELGRSGLSPLNSAYQTVSGTVLWGPDPNPQITANTPVPVNPAGMTLTVPAESTCAGSESYQIGTEIRVGSTSAIDISTPTCAALAAAAFGDCWSRLSTIRIFKSAPVSQDVPWIRSVSAAPVAPCAPDAYFARATTCSYSVGVDIDWRDWDEAGPLPNYNGLDDSSSFRLRVNGVDLNPPAANQPTGVWTGVISNSTMSGSALTLNWRWRNRVPAAQNDRFRTLQCQPNNSNPCERPLAQNAAGVDVVVHRVFLADDTNAGPVDMVRTAGGIQTSGNPPLAPLDNIQAGGSQTTMTVYPSIGLRSLLAAGQRRVLRANSSQDNLSINCDPDINNTFRQFLYGCQKWYGRNQFIPNTTFWEPDGSGGFRCPVQNDIFAQPNSAATPWLCTAKGQGLASNTIAAGIAAAIGNCSNITGNPPNESGCSAYACTNPNLYPNWQPDDPRIVNLIVLPYGALRNTNPSDGLPILKFGAFYVTGWQGQGGGNQNPCGAAQGEDTTVQPGQIVGYFINYVDINGGPTNPTAACDPTAIDPCRAVLVR